MQLRETALHGARIGEQTLYHDPRGSFLESYSLRVFAAKGLNLEFVQDNCSYSVSARVIRGLHFQRSPHVQS